MNQTPLPRRRSLRRPARALLLVLAACVTWFAAPAHSADDLPPGIVAQVGERSITETDYLLRLARLEEGSERGAEILEQLLEDRLVHAEAARVGESVSEAETRAYMEQVDRTIREQTGGVKGLVDVFKEEGSNETEFLRIAREYLLRQKLARRKFGSKPGEEVPERRVKLWLHTLKAALKGAGGEPGPDEVRVLGDHRITRLDFARALRKRLPDEFRKSVLDEMIFEVVAERELAREGIVVTDEQIDREIERLRERFAEDPRVAGTELDFDEFLRKTRGFGLDELRVDPTFRARIGVKQLLSRDIDEKDLRSHWEKNRDSYGERALVRFVYFPAGTGKGAFADRMPTFQEAHERALRARIAIYDLAGKYDPDKKGVPVADAVTQVAKQFESDEKRRATAGEPTAWTHGSVAGHPDLTAAAFEGETGEVQGPIRTDIGYYLVVVEERRPAPTYDEIRDLLREHVVRNRMNQFRLSKMSTGILRAE